MEVVIWQENVEVFNVFQAMSTQWRYSMNGVTGLDYSALPVTLRLTGIKRDEWSQMFDDIRIMESAALAEINKKDK